MLSLRRATVASAGSIDGSEQTTVAPGEEVPIAGREQTLTVRLEGGVSRPAIADVGLVGACEVGDEVIVNVQALDLGLGSGGFDIVHANLTRGLDGRGADGVHVMKLNYTSLQHAVNPVEEGSHDLRLPVRGPVGVLALHGQLAPLAWAFAQAAPGRRLGFVHTPGGALPGGHSRTVTELRRRGLLTGHVTAGSAYGGEEEAMTVAGALHHGLAEHGWDAAVCGPGPGIVGCDSALGHGGMQALDSAHAALALGAPTLVVARMSSADPRERHRGISHHTLTVLRLSLGRVVVALPEDPSVVPPSDLDRHKWHRRPVDLAGYASSGLPAATMGRTLEQDPLFFAAALAAGGVLAEMR